MSAGARTDQWKALLLSPGYTANDPDRVRTWSRLLVALCQQTVAPETDTSALPESFDLSAYDRWLSTRTEMRELNDDALAVRLEFQLHSVDLRAAVLELAGQFGMRFEQDAAESDDDSARRLTDYAATLESVYLSVLADELEQASEVLGTSLSDTAHSLGTAYTDQHAHDQHPHDHHAHDQHAHDHHGHVDQVAQQAIAHAVEATQQELERLIELAETADPSGALTRAERMNVVLNTVNRALADTQSGSSQLAGRSSTDR